MNGFIKKHLIDMLLYFKSGPQKQVGKSMQTVMWKLQRNTLAPPSQNATDANKNYWADQLKNTKNYVTYLRNLITSQVKFLSHKRELSHLNYDKVPNITKLNKQRNHAPNPQSLENQNGHKSNKCSPLECMTIYDTVVEILDKLYSWVLIIRQHIIHTQ